MITSLSVAEARAQILHAALLKSPAATCVDDLPRALPEFARWRPDILGAAIADLVADGRITESPAGRLRVHVVEEPTS
ncbi:hypothetical protein DSM104299_00984 [Baekduia alba]|uniref:hypothetical protein n=1 Tax=Baekduia alba TaxID=2997333 RepID=UPI002342731F|nr:hypothetical protein [Baekduia alba]WCB92294.1 hypothetical protein DSM104299_00984 [Baekduia alba]